MRITLVTDGSSDRVLIPIIEWCIRSALADPSLLFVSEYADLSMLPRPPKGLTERILAAIELYPCDIIVVHRDAEGADLDIRIGEINEAWTTVSECDSLLVPVVPVRMTEAWLLLDENAIRQAAGNPNGRVRLPMPAPNSWEGIADPKATIVDLLKAASELSGRRLRKFRSLAARNLVSEFIDDFSPLRQLVAFQRFEHSLKEAVSRLAAD